MLKIGILTLSASNNCGSLLQTYALKKLLEEYGDVEVINFSSIKSHEMYDIISLKRGKRDALRRIIKFRNLWRERKDYSSFRKKYLNIKGKELYSKDLEKISHNYDVVVVGSDQVWNINMFDFDDAFFLEWAQSKKISYACSLGNSDLKNSDNYNHILHCLRSFSSISVREETGKKCLEDCLKQTIEKTLDPTLVISENVWRDFIKSRYIHSDYIFFYSWAYCDNSTLSIVCEESKKSGLPVYVIDSRKWISKNPKDYNFRLYPHSGPIVFLNLMKYATKCYVESFHGMVFAYTFKKNFWLLDTHSRFDDLDLRLKEFVELLGSESRILTKYNVDQIDQDKQFNYSKNMYLQNMKEKSIKYLKDAFSE